MSKNTLQNKIQNLIKPLFTAIKYTSLVFIVPARPLQAFVALALVLILVSASYSPAQANSPKKFKPTQVALNVFPTAVSSDTWGNINTIGSQDLGENSLFQEFNGSNSAYLGSDVKIPKAEPVSVPVTPPVSEDGADIQSSPEAGVDVSSDNTSEVDVSTEPEVEDIYEPEVEEPVVEEAPAAEGESAVISSPLIFSVIKFLTNSFKLAVAEIVKPIPSAAAQEVTESTPAIIETPAAPVVVPEVVTEPVVSPVPEVAEEVVEAEPVVSSPVIEESASGSVPVIETEEESEEGIDETIEAEVLPMPQTGPAHTISFTGFDVPNFESGQFIDNLQLRLSLAGSYKANSEELLPSLKISYSFETFSGDAGTVLLDDEISNALNGGYYLIPFPQITDPELLSDLTISITFDGDMERLDSLYLDAAWLEVTTVVYSKELLMERFSLEEMFKHLKAPDFMEFMSEQIDFGRDELPRFNLRYESQKNALMQALRSLFSSEFATISEVVFSRNGNVEADITPDVSITDEGLITISLSEEDAEVLKPGTYEVDVTVDEGGEKVTDSFEFQWGLLTINTNQTEYGASEVVGISMGALTSKGNTICDADLNLFITDPTGFISSVPVATSGQCFGNNVVDVPDYSTQFVTDSFGEYEMYLEKVDETGSVVSHITETFLVVPNQDIVIERTGPTRIFPPAQYEVELSIHALTRSFNGQLIERVPAGFEIFDTDAEIREQGNYKELVWDISMLSENTETVSYSFDAPDISPYLFNLGAAKLITDEEVTTTSMVEVVTEVDPNSTSTDEVVPTFEEFTFTSSEETVIFEEHRRWQIASDALQPGIPALAESPAFDSVSVKSTRPKLGGFAAYDPDGDVVEYEIQIDDDINFGSVNVNAGSVNFPTDSGWSSATFASGATTTYTVRPADALTNGVTYWWRVRAKDPTDTNTWTSYSQPRSVTIDTSTVTSRWFQTLGHQFSRGSLSGLSTTTGTVSLPVSTTVPTLVPGWTVNSVNPGATLTLTKPASVNIGDLLIIIVGDEDTTNTAQWDDTTNKPTGFTLIQEAGDANADAHVAAFYRVADGTEGSTVDVPSQSSDGYWGFYMRVTGADPVTPINVAGAGSTSGNSTSKAIPSITTTVANTLAFYALAADGGDTDPFSVSGTGWTEQDERESGTTGNDAAGTWGTRSMTSAGATGNATVNISQNEGASYFQFAINPAPINYGTIMSPEIDFDWVAGQDTWGDVLWSVTEPAGTVTNLQVYYTNVTACDTIVPDIALPGNSTGFTAADSGLYIFGLSTSTYNRICLNMALDLGTGGSAPSLNDWTVRYDLPNQTPIAPVVTNNPAFDNLFATTTPVLGTFSTFDYDGDNLEYQLILDNDYNFSSPVFTKQSSNYPTDAGWDTDTYASSNGGAWYNPSWPYRIPVTISSDLINEPLTDFPVYVKLASLGGGFFADLTATGGDIRVTSADGITEMPREVFGVSTGSGVGELYFEADSLSDEDDTLFYIYYGNTGASDYAASDPYGSQNVWANNYEAVYHMEADPSTGAPQYIDSTGNSAGTAGSMEGADRVTGLAGYAADIDGVDEQITTSYTGGVFSNSTWSIWLNADGTQGGCDSPMFARGGGGSTTGLNVGACGSVGKIGYHWNDTSSSYNWTGGPDYPTDQWFLASMVVVPTQATVYAFTAGGVTSGSNILAHASTNVNALTFGRDPSGAARSFDGTMEEARLSSVARSQNWLSAEYYNIASSSDFYATSSRQSQTFSNATYRIQPADALSDGATYWWKVRARDPLGTNTWGDYSEARSLTIDSGLIERGWHQTLGYQFEDGVLTNMSTTTTGVQLTTIGVGSVITTDTFESLADANTTFAGTTIWKQATVSTDDGSWQAETASTASGTTGPDAASQGSVFIYTEASSGGSCDNTGTANNCAIEADISDGTLDGIQFDYHMFGNNMGTLSLDLYDGSAWTTVWSRTGAQSVDELDWLDSGYLDLVPYKDDTTVMRFFADGDGGGYSGDFALDNIRISTSTPSTGVILSPEIDFSWVPDDSDWGLIEWDVTEPVGTDSRMRVYYSDAGVCDTMVPNIVLPGNAAGFDKLNSPLFIDGLSTTTYDKICLRMTADAGGTASSPVLESWSVKWVIPNQVPSVPSLSSLPSFNNMKSSTTAPVFGGFSSSDYEDDSIEFQIVIDDDYAFGSPTLTKQSSNYPTDAGWSAATFSGNSTTTYAIQPGDALVAGTTYWWKVRARDPLGSNEWSEYTTPKSMTISSVLNYPEWYQTTSNQFLTSFTTKRNATSTPGGMTLSSTTTAVRSLDPWTTTNTKTISDGSNRLLLVSIISEDSGVNTNVNTVTYGGQLLTQIEDQNIGTGYSNGMWVGYLNEAGIAATVGTTITPTWVGGTPNNGIGYNVATFENVRQSSPVRDKSYNAYTSGQNTTPAAAINAIAGDMMVYFSETAQGITHTAATGYTEGIEQEVVVSGDEFTHASAFKKITTSGSEYPTAIWSATGNRLVMIALDLAPSPATASIMSPEVDFDWVSGQADWGEVIWNVNEPTGSDSIVQVYYSNVGTCDTIVPNGALPGNSAGFDEADSPIDISSLSIVTYNRICLKTTLSHGTTESPTLLDWGISWEKSAVFEQSGYRWYVNNDSITPTDTWPAGATAFELAENAPINISQPTQTGDVLRLRMGTRVTSVAATANQFKLQYSEAEVCSPDSDWFDVAPISSSTALWKGYNNASVAEGTTLPSSLLSLTNVRESYEEENTTSVIPNTISIGQYAEWDWVLENKATPGTSYCFRMTTPDGKRFKTYTNYPKLSTNKSPTIASTEAPFDNEKLADTTPEFIFTGVDAEGNEVDYNIQIDNDADFSSAVINHNSITNFTYFNNTQTLADKSPFNQSEKISYIVPTALSNGVTYWWRVRSIDPNNSAKYGEWSTAKSFTIDTSVVITTWFQTTEEQFDTDVLEGTDASAADRVGFAGGFSAGTTTSSAIDFDDLTTGNAWGELKFTETGAANDILYHIEYYNGYTWSLIPDGALPGNSTGYDNSPVSLIDLDTETYNQIRIRANFRNGTPYLNDWTITWGERVSVPTHFSLFDNEKTDNALPTFTFLSTDPQSNDLVYEFSYSTDNTFTSSTTVNSATAPGFVNLSNGANFTPFTSGDTISYTVQSALSNNVTYWWRARAKDPFGGNSYSFWSEPWSFTISSTATTSTWFQTTEEQFNTDTLVSLTTLGVDSITTIPAAVSNYNFAGVTSPSATHIARDFEIDVNDPTDPPTIDAIDTITISGTNAGSPNLLSGIAGYASDAEATNAQYTSISASDNSRWTITNPGAGDNAVFWAKFHVDEVAANISQLDILLEGYQQSATDVAWLGIWRPGTTTPYWQDLSHSQHTSDFNYTGSITSNITEYLDGNNDVHIIFFNEDDSDSLYVDFVQLTVTSDTATEGKITGTPVDFNDGSGPAWGQMTWSDTKPGASSIKYQVEYLNGVGVWELIPNVALAGNAAGFTSTPIDLKYLNTTTYNEIRPVANLTCSGASCPTLNDWTIEWSRGFTVSGTAVEYDGTTPSTSGTVAVAVNGVLQIGKTGTISAGAWSIDNVTYFTGDVVTVFVNGATDANEAVAITKYDGTPDITGMKLQKRHLTIGSNDNATLSNINIGTYDVAEDEDLFYSVDGGNDLNMCATTGCTDAGLVILANNAYAPAAGADLVTHDFTNNGTVTLTNNTWRVSGSYDNNATTTMGASTVVMTATSGTETIDSTGASLASFFNLTLGETSGTANWTLNSTLDVNGNFGVAYGTLARGTQPVSIAKNLTVGAAGYWTGMGTTTFDGINPTNWTDNNAVDQNVGRVVVDGTTKTMLLGTSALAESMYIGANDILDLNGKALSVNGNWINTNTFNASLGTVNFTSTVLGREIATNGSAFYNLNFNGVGGSWSFTNPLLTVTNDFTISTGTVTMNTGTTTIAGSFINNGGTFMHNNSVIDFTSNGSEVITQKATAFLNAFYNLKFSGAGSWTITDTNATTTNYFLIESGSVTLPSGTFFVGGDYKVTGGAFTHNSGEVVLDTDGTQVVSTNGSNFNNLRFIGNDGTPWYNSSWSRRTPVAIQSSEVSATLTNYPVYIDLSTLGSTFWANVQAGGGDIRVTTADGSTEVPVEVAVINSIAKTGEIYFKAPTVSSSADTTFYIYYGNALATAYSVSDTYGREKVWTNGYEAVYHLLGTTDSTSNGRTLTEVGTPTQVGSGYDLDGDTDFLTMPTDFGIFSGASDVTAQMFFNADAVAPSTSYATSPVLLSFAGENNAFFGFGDGEPGDSLIFRYQGWTTQVVIPSFSTDTDYTVTWTYRASDGAASFYRDGSVIDTSTGAFSAAAGTNGSMIGGLSTSDANRAFDGTFYEVRIINTPLSAAWVAADDVNMTSPTTFYATSTSEVVNLNTRTFTDTNVTVLGDLMIEEGTIEFPTGTLSIAGSLDNDSFITHKNGSVLFNSSDTGETVNAGASSLYNVDFNSASGGWTVLSTTTANNNFSITNASDWTLVSGRAVTVGGNFTNSVGGAATTWTGSTLTLSGGDHSINTKAVSGDVYAALQTVGDTDIKMWNSSANSFLTASTSSIYSQDHAAVDGDLYIFGNYTRTTGTEYWNRAVDFDGVSLSGSERAVNVRIAPSAFIGIENSSFSIVGAAGASTTIASQSGTFGLSATNTALTAQYFTVANTNASGFVLAASTTIPTFSDGYFNVNTLSSGITVDATTIDANAAKQIFNVGFNSVGSATNVTQNGGSPVSNWWFRDSFGNIYGEAFDNDTGNPGSISWDNSTYGITISGKVYSDEGVTALSYPVCDDVTPVVKIMINGVTSYSGACSSVDGSYSISGVTYSGDPNIVTYIDSNGAASQPATVTLRSETTGTGTTNVTTGVFTVNKPATVSNGDLLVVIIGKDDSPAISAPAGWTTGDSLGSGTGNLIRSGIWYKRVTNAATEPASYSFTGDANEGFSYWSGSLVNADPITPQDVTFTGKFVNSQNDTTPNALSVTTVTPGAYVLAVSYIDNDNAVTAPTGSWSTRAVNVFSTDNNNLVVSSRIMTSAGATGATTVSGVAGSMESNNGQFAFRRMTYASSTVRGAVITRTPTVSISNMDIYQNRVITRHENTSPLSIANMFSYQNSNDTDIPFSVTLGTPNVLNTLYGSELHVWAGKTFAPAGNMTLQGTGSVNSYDGSLHIGAGATLTGAGTSTYSVAGNITQETGATFVPASTTVVMTATTTGKAIVPAAGATLPFNTLNFTGVGGAWNLNGNISATAGINVATGTVTGTGNINVTGGSLYGNGTLSLGGGTTTISGTNTLGGTRAWTFYNLNLGDGATVGTTTPAGTATTTVSGKLTIANAHTLNASNSIWDLSGTSNVFVKTGTLAEGTSTFRYSGANSNVLSTNYYNLLISAGVGSATYTASAGGLQVKNNLTVGGATNSTLNLNSNDPVTEVKGNVQINSNGTVDGTSSGLFSVLGNWTNLGVFTSNLGTVNFTGAGTSNIAAGNSSFSNVVINGTGNFNVTQNATSTGTFTLTNHNVFTVNSGQQLAVGGLFTNTLGGAATTWTGSTLSLYGTGNYAINTKSTSDTYGTLTVGSGTQVRMWNSDAAAYSVNANGSLYSQDHALVDGNLYIWGKLARTTGADYWSYATDFDGTSLTGVERVANVYFASGASAAWSGGSLTAVGGTGATTTIQNQGSGTYGLTMGTGSTVNWSRVQVRDTNSSGIVLSGTAAVTDFSRTDHLVAINSGTAITLGGTVINANPAKNFTNNVFAASGGVTSPVNVTATGTAISSWRFTNHTGNIAGEAYDSDPAGDPGYIVWDDSAALITVAGNVYSDEGSTVSPACDGSTNNIRLVVAGITTYNTSCNASTGAYSITNVAFGPVDTLTLYINDEPEKAANVSTSPISSISNMNLYENRVIVRHENTDPITIAKMAVWDSSDDADIQFTAVDAGTDTLTIPANNKLLIWTAKTFEPNGNITLTGGAGTAYNGMLEAQDNAIFRAKGTETHSVGGSIVFGTGAVYTSASSTLNLTTTGTGRTFDVNSATVNNLNVTGSGSWSVTDSTLTTAGSYTQSAGTMTFPTGTTTIGAAFNVTGGSFVNNNSPFVFTANGAGNTVRFSNSLVRSLDFTGTGSWNMTDTNATSTGSVVINSGTLTLPSGNFAVGGDFKKLAGNIVHNTSDIIMTATTTAVVTASSSDLFAIKFTGPAAYTITDPNITFLDSFTIANGSVLVGTGTMSVGGSFIATGGTFNNASGTVLMNASASGKTINPGVSPFYNLQIGAPAGGYTMYSATTTNNFTLASANIFTVNPGATINVGGVFSNTVGGVATTWTNSTLKLNGASAYSVNSRVNNGDVYGTLAIGPNSDIKTWYSSAATTTVDVSSSLYSQDNANVNGALNIYGDLVMATTTEYWNYARDFDGTDLTGSERKVTVSFAPNATTTVTTGSLQIIGASGFETSLKNQGTGAYSMIVNGGSLNANYYEMKNLNILGLQLKGLSTITDLANGYFDLSVDTGSLITLASTTLNANPSKIFSNIGFNATTSLSGYNVNLVGVTTNAWRLTSSYGNIDGEDFNIDGVDDCGSIRFDDSACLLTEQTQVRWRNDDGGEGVPASEWFNTDWDARKSVRVVNADGNTYTNAAVQLFVTYDTDMQADFDDLYFTSSNGVTPVPFWIASTTNSGVAEVWVKVASLPANDASTLFMYYKNPTATTTYSSSTQVFIASDSFEDGNISEYSGQTSLFDVDTTFNYDADYGLDNGGHETSRANLGGVYRFDQTVSQGQVFRYLQYIDTSAGSGDEVCTLFGVQSPGSTNNNYGVCIEQFGVDRISLVKNVVDNDSSGTVLASSTVSLTTGWYEVEVKWGTDNTLNVSMSNMAGTAIATVLATDSSYTSGGYGFTFWFHNGGWDAVSSRPLLTNEPSVFFGAEQGDGGATWLSARNAPAYVEPNDIVRLRLAIENSGLDITGHQYRLEYAPKGVAPTCESVSSGTYATVPNQASCGLSPVCMQTSTFISNGGATTDKLIGTNGQFTAGKIVTSPSNQAGSMNIDQDYYTELEYVLTPTTNATDDYCLRVTNAGSDLDFYANIAELGIRFEPSFGALTLNSGSPISLTPGTTTAVTVVGTVTDLNGYADLSHATATIYRSGAGASCTADNNNCYLANTDSGMCSFDSCSGNSCQLSCTVNIQFHADPTDASTFEGEEWLAYAEASDFASGYDFASAPGVELITLRAVEVDSLINYGSLEVDSDTGAFNPSTAITNIGNVPINIDIEGTNLTDGLSSSIPAEQQKVATSTFTYSSCVTCQQLSTSSPVMVGINLGKPTNIFPPVVTDVYWGIAVPFSASAAPHSGTNVFTPIGVD